MSQSIRDQLCQHIQPNLVERLLDYYRKVKDKYSTSDYEGSELNAGKFAEIAIRVLQDVTGKAVTPLGRRIRNFHDVADDFAHLSSRKFPRSIRLQIPKVLKAIYDIRSDRGVGHAAGDVDPNYSDATFMVAACNWVMVEFVRLYHTTSVDEAQKLVGTLARRGRPIMQIIDGFPKVLAPELSIPDQIRLHLYVRGGQGALLDELGAWVKTGSPGYLRTAVKRLDESADIHFDGEHCWITEKGIRYVEENIPLQLE